MFRVIRVSVFCLVAFAAGLVVLGCNAEPPTFQTSGEVVYSDTGELVPGSLTIWLEATNPPYQRSLGIVTDGKFTLGTSREDNGSIAGEHRVRFDPFVPNGAALESAESALGRVMHTKYLEFRTSGLVVKIEATPTNTLRLTVDPPPGRKGIGKGKPTPK